MVLLSLVVAATIVWQLVFYLSFAVYYMYVVFRLVIIICLLTVHVVVGSVCVVPLCRDLTPTESRAKVWRL